MALFNDFLLSIFDTGIILLLVHSIKKDLPFKFLYSIIYIFITSICVALMNKYITNDVISHLLSTSISIVTLYYYLYMNGFKKKVYCLLLYIVTLLFILTIQLLGIIILNLLIGNVKFIFNNGIILQVLNVVMVLFARKFIPLSLINTFIEEHNLKFSIIITTTFVLFYGVTILWFYDVKNINNFILIIITINLFAITINTVILREGFTNEMYKEKLAIYDTYFPVIDDMIGELRSKQHDYHNQIQTIIAMKKDEFNSDKDIEDYIDEMNNNNLWKDLLKLDNRVMSAFLYSKMNEGINSNISFKISIQDFSLPSIYSSYQLVEMYGILIDNAIEAVRVNNSNSKRIELLIYRTNDMNIFEVKNDFDYISVADINNFFSNGFTTKKGKNKGIGLHKLKKMVQAKNGTIDFFYDTALEQVNVKLSHY